MTNCSRLLCAVCACAVIAALAGCQSTSDGQPPAPQTVTTDVVIEQAPPAVNLIKNDDPRVTVDHLRQVLDQLSTEQGVLDFWVFEMSHYHCAVDAELIEGLRLDEWQQADIDPTAETHHDEWPFRAALEECDDGTIYLTVCDNYAMLELIVPVEYQASETHRATIDQQQAVTYFELPQETSSEIKQWVYNHSEGVLTR